MSSVVMKELTFEFDTHSLSFFHDLFNSRHWLNNVTNFPRSVGKDVSVRYPVSSCDTERRG